MFTFQKAQRAQRKARIALIGPSGSGKTYTALQLAKGLAGPNGRIAVIDTENNSAALYADEFEFDVLNLDTFSPEVYIQAIRAAEAAGYDVLIIDSLSHAWAGKEGALEQVDKVARRMQTTNTFAAWREVTPMHNALVDAMVRCKCHLIVTMRAKTEYVVEKDEKTGKTTPRKVGLAPIQRDGLEYEFDIVADMDIDNNFIVSKTRYKPLTGAVINKPKPELGREILVWLESGAPMEDVPRAQAQPIGQPQAAAPAAPAAANGSAKGSRNDNAMTIEEALKRYHAAAAAKLPNEQDRKDFLRYAAWKMAAAKYADGKGPAPVLPASTKDVPIGTISSIVKRVVDLDGEALLSLLNEWRREHAETEDPVPDGETVQATRGVS
ncbi:MAG: ATP-binding protein [Bacillota bacterium]|nr:MAG: ATP-binding protein [Bacillota bacterium]